MLKAKKEVALMSWDSMSFNP